MLRFVTYILTTQKDVRLIGACGDYSALFNKVGDGYRACGLTLKGLRQAGYVLEIDLNIGRPYREFQKIATIAALESRRNAIEEPFFRFALDYLKY